MEDGACWHQTNELAALGMHQLDASGPFGTPFGKQCGTCFSLNKNTQGKWDGIRRTGVCIGYSVQVKRMAPPILISRLPEEALLQEPAFQGKTRGRIP